jgi:hypothetical protein
MGKRHLKAKHLAVKHLAARHLTGPASTGIGHFAARHFKAYHWAARHLAGGFPVPEDEETTPPRPGGGAGFDRNRAKRIGTFPDLPRFRSQKKRDDDILFLAP